MSQVKRLDGEQRGENGSPNRLSRRRLLKGGGAGAAALAGALVLGIEPHAPEAAAVPEPQVPQPAIWHSGLDDFELRRYKISVSYMAQATRKLLHSDPSRFVLHTALPGHEAIDEMLAAVEALQRSYDRISPYYCVAPDFDDDSGIICYDPSWAHLGGECLGCRDDHGYGWATTSYSTYSQHEFKPATDCPAPEHDLPYGEYMKLPDGWECPRCDGHGYLLVGVEVAQ